MVETKQQTTVWPYWQVVGPPAPCTCGGCKFARLGDGAAWQCERCQVVVSEGEVVVGADRELG